MSSCDDGMVDCSECGAGGTVVENGEIVTCPSCDGDKQVLCPNCHGTGCS